MSEARKQDFISIYEPNIKKYKKSAIKAIEDGWISNHGKFVQLSTNKLKEIVKSKYVILMANGTCATHCLFLSLKYKYPTITKIYVPNNCYVAGWNATLMEYNINQLEVMNMDIDTWNINTTEEYIKSLEENSAMLIVHNLGNIVNVPRLKRLRPDIIFVEDNCEGMFGRYENTYSGMSSASLCSSCSFYGNKTITTGEGGAFFTNDDGIYEHISKVYSQGMSDTKYLHNKHAYNYRMTNIEAGFLYEQLNDIPNILKNKYKIFNNYDTLLNNLVNTGKICLIEHEENTLNSPWIYALRIKNNNNTIENTTTFFKNNNVDIRPFFYPIDCHEHLKTIQNTDEISHTLNKDIIMIPSSPNITINEQQYVVNQIQKFIFHNENIDVVELDVINTKHVYNKFLKNIKNKSFRYYDVRNAKHIQNHVLTCVLFDKIMNKYIGYAHIDYDSMNDKHWFGIYIDELYQQNQFGTMLMNYMLGHEKVVYLTEIYLGVDKTNERALKLYKRFNFNIDEERNTYYFMKLTKR
jgi:perosamine synthetase